MNPLRSWPSPSATLSNDPMIDQCLLSLQPFHQRPMSPPLYVNPRDLQIRPEPLPLSTVNYNSSYGANGHYPVEGDANITSPQARDERRLNFIDRNSPSQFHVYNDVFNGYAHISHQAFSAGYSLGYDTARAECWQAFINVLVSQRLSTGPDKATEESNEPLDDDNLWHAWIREDAPIQNENTLARDKKARERCTYSLASKSNLTHDRSASRPPDRLMVGLDLAESGRPLSFLFNGARGAKIEYRS